MSPVLEQRGALRGRTRECAVLDDIVSAVRRGESRTLMMRGEAGIGKTALLDYLAVSGSDMTIVHANGEESESELAWAGLHQLCGPLLDGLERLPAPRRRAVDVVFGLSSGEAPDRFLVGLAVLSLLTTVAEQRPLLCLVDDAQWLDQVSALTLGFVARRLASERVGVAFASRDRVEGLCHLPELEIRGVPSVEAHALLDSAAPFTVDERIRETIIAETRGNPRALLEWSHGCAVTELAGGFGLPGIGALTERIEHGLVRRLEKLPEDARLLLLVAAAEPTGDPLLLWRAVERLRIQPAAAETTHRDGLLAIGDRVTLGHAMLRSVVYRLATAEARRRVHLALAEATDPDTDADRRAWHLASAATGPDEQTAALLEGAADVAQARGGSAAAAAFLQRAVALTSGRASRADRALAAAQASLQAGAFEEALSLLATAEADPPDEHRVARVDLVRARVTQRAFLGNDAPALLLNAASRLEKTEAGLARDTYLAAWDATCHAGRSVRADVLPTICGRVRALPRPQGLPRPRDLLLDGLVLLSEDNYSAATPTLQRAAQALSDLTVDDVVQWGSMAVYASGLVWDFDGMFATSARQVQVVREVGALAALPSALSNLALATLWTGDFTGAALLIAETASTAAATGSRIAPYALLRLQGLQGNEVELSRLLPGAIETAESTGQGMVVDWGHWAAAVAYNGLARYDQATAAAEHVISGPGTWWSLWVLPELVEGAARTGNVEAARHALERLAATTQPCGTDFALGIEARCRALLSDRKLAEDRYREAVDTLSRTPLHPELARAHLLYGEWLRRENRRCHAREQLHAAHEMFVAIGMHAFGERARKELMALGDKVRNRSVATRLTPQERHIAALANDGLSNSEIGGRLFLSPRTVEWHLRNVFTKLDVRCRRELAIAFSSSEPPGVLA